MLDHFVYDEGPTNIFYTSRLFHVNFYLAPFISCSVQVYFIYRLWVVSRSYALLVGTGTLSLVSKITNAPYVVHCIEMRGGNRVARSIGTRS